MTKSPITWVKTFGFTMALGRPFSFLLLLLSKLLLGDEAALHVVVVVPFVVTALTTLVVLALLPPPPMQLSSATDVDVVNVGLLVVLVPDDGILSGFTAVVDGVVVVVVGVDVVATVSATDFDSTFEASSPAI